MLSMVGYGIGVLVIVVLLAVVVWNLWRSARQGEVLPDSLLIGFDETATFTAEMYNTLRDKPDKRLPCISTAPTRWDIIPLKRTDREFKKLVERVNDLEHRLEWQSSPDKNRHCPECDKARGRKG